MKTMVQNRWNVRGIAMALMLAVLIPASVLRSEDAPAASGAEAKPTKKRTEPRGRLPAHFNEVVSSEQRDKIYDLQSKYLTQIMKLQDDITKLEASRDKDVLDVLSAEQLAKVKQMQADAKAKRAAASTARKKSDSGTPTKNPAGDGSR